jgi:hypothetical protein
MGDLNEVDTTQSPDFTTTNDKGEPVKWWKCRPLTQWAKRKDTHDVSLPNVRGWVVEDPLGLSYVLTEGQEIVYSTQRYEDAAVHIDVMKLNRNYDKYDKP